GAGTKKSAYDALLEDIGSDDDYGGGSSSRGGGGITRAKPQPQRSAAPAATPIPSLQRSTAGTAGTARSHVAASSFGGSSIGTPVNSSGRGAGGADDYLAAAFGVDHEQASYGAMGGYGGGDEYGYGAAVVPGSSGGGSFGEAGPHSMGGLGTAPGSSAAAFGGEGVGAQADTGKPKRWWQQTEELKNKTAGLEVPPWARRGNPALGQPASKAAVGAGAAAAAAGVGAPRAAATMTAGAGRAAAVAERAGPAGPATQAGTSKPLHPSGVAPPVQWYPLEFETSRSLPNCKGKLQGAARIVMLVRT
ncbi:hypothetical protein DUNSADRAFT_5539, partial [Dunaliella salina]